jgi:hypothetical protein
MFYLNISSCVSLSTYRHPLDSRRIALLSILTPHPFQMASPQRPIDPMVLKKPIQIFPHTISTNDGGPILGFEHFAPQAVPNALNSRTSSDGSNDDDDDDGSSRDKGARDDTTEKVGTSCG